jgi:hypothetical protein
MARSLKKNRKASKCNRSHTYHQHPWKHIGIWDSSQFLKICCHIPIELVQDQPQVHIVVPWLPLWCQGNFDCRHSLTGHKRYQRTLDLQHLPNNMADHCLACCGAREEVWSGWYQVHWPQPLVAKTWPLSYLYILFSTGQSPPYTHLLHCFFMPPTPLLDLSQTWLSRDPNILFKAAKIS